MTIVETIAQARKPCRRLHRALELRPRKERDRQRIEQALKKHCHS
jgi:hypothetical protein